MYQNLIYFNLKRSSNAGEQLGANSTVLLLSLKLNIGIYYSNFRNLFNTKIRIGLIWENEVLAKANVFFR